jgi:hypothetical protein
MGAWGVVRRQDGSLAVQQWQLCCLTESHVVLLLLQVCRLPVAVLGLLQHSQQLLSDEAVYGEERIIVVLPNHLSVLHRAACEQPGMIPKVGARAYRGAGVLGGRVGEHLARAVVSGVGWRCVLFM